MRSVARNLPASKKERTVVVLQADTAYWFKVHDGEIVSYHAGPVLSDSSNDACSCPWLVSRDHGEAQSVELVMDTTMDELDRISVERHANSLVNRYRRIATHYRLRRDYKEAVLYGYPKQCGEHVAALLHSVVPEHWSKWLVGQQAGNIVFGSVATGSELAASWSSQFEKRVLLIMGVGGYERHILVDKGIALFLRTVPTVHVNQAGSAEAYVLENEALVQTLDVLQATPLLQNAMIDVVSLQCSSGPIDEYMVHAVTQAPSRRLKVKDGIAQTSLNWHAYSLVAMMVGFEPEYVIATLDGSALESTEVALSEPGWGKAFASINPITRILRVTGNCKRNSEQWNITRSAARSLSALSVSLAYSESSRRIAMVTKFSFVFALLAGVVATAGMVNGVASVLAIRQQKLQRDSILQKEVLLHDTAVDMVQLPVQAADSLILANKLERESGDLSAKVLGQVATAITTVPGIGLDTLVWTQLNIDEPFEAVAHALNLVPVKDTFEEGSAEPLLQLELSGSVAGANLADQKTLLDTFVIGIRQMPGVRDLRVLQSPVDAALSSEEPERRADQYRVSIGLGGR